MASSSEANDHNKNSNASPISIELVDEIEGDYGEGDQYYFDKIGGSLPLNPNGSKFSFDVDDLPQKPLAVSERFCIIFVADPSGFFVARTKDVIDCAKEMKAKTASASSIKELSLIYVSIGKVHILALSSDNSRLAVTGSGHIYFFSVDSLVNGETKHLFSTSLSESDSVKDIIWKRNTQSNYIVLSRSGSLYSGVIGAPLREVLDNVDAVECSVKRELIAVARNNLLSIFSSEFKEQFRMLLSFKSWSAAADENFIVKVDSIRWIRLDCIVLGCFQLSEDGKEENYFLQIIRSRDGHFGDVSSEICVHSFTDLFSGIVDDSMPFGSGPYLIMSYLDQCQLSITANRKNTDGHILLLGWLPDDANSEPCILHIERDKWVPRIELQENGDDNLVLGLCVDRVSISEKVNVQIGLENCSELLPFCVLICLTLDGRLVMFHVASETGTAAAAEFVSAASTDDNLFFTEALQGGAIVSSKIGKEEQEKVTSSSQDMKKIEITNLGSHSSHETCLSAAEGNKDLTSEPVSFHHQTSNTTKRHEVELSSKLVSSKVDRQKIVPSTKPDIAKNSKTFPQYQQPGTDFGRFYEASASGQHKGFFDTRNLAIAGVGTAPNSFLGKTSFAAPAQSDNETLQFSEETTMKSLKENEQFPCSHIPYGPKLASASGFSAPSVSLPSTNFGATNMFATEVSGNLAVRVSKEMSTHITADPLCTSVQSGRQRGPIEAEKIEALPSIHGSRLLSPEKGIVELQKFIPSQENRRISAASSTVKSEPNLPKQLQNINETFKELDVLLESIEGTGGYTDACTTSLKNSIEALEQGMAILSERCKTWRNLGDERLKGIQCLLDDTVQVLARKICMEGIIKQASDSRYWNLWNRQKLNSELELKRQNILSMHHEMIDQLIQLEWHFNALEFNKYGEKGDTPVGDKIFRNRYGPSRYTKSLHCLHSATSSQLVTAEHLSECLSKQLAALSVNSSSQTKKNVKKEMFEMIGIPYDESFCSPVSESVSNASRKELIPSGHSINQDLSRSVAFKNSEPESARRRRDSLNQRWASFQPSKTTVKRIALQEVQKGPDSKFKFPNNALGTQPRGSERSGSAFERELTSPLTTYGNNADAGRKDKALTSLSEKPKPFVWSSNVLEQTKFSRSKTQNLPNASHLSSPISKSHAKETHDTGRLNAGPSASIPPIVSSVYLPFDAPKQLTSSSSNLSLSRSTFDAPKSQVQSALAATFDAPKSQVQSALTATLDTPKSQFQSALAATLDTPKSQFHSALAATKSDSQAIATSISKIAPVAPVADAVEAQPLVDESDKELKSSTISDFSGQVISSGQTNANLSSSANLHVNSQPQKSTASLMPSLFLSSSATVRNGDLDVGIEDEDEMEEEALETTTSELNFGNLAGFGMGSITNSTSPKPNPFGSFSNSASNLASSGIPPTVPTGELFRPASFTLQSSHSSPQPQSTNSGPFSGGFGSGATIPTPTQGFGQPSQIGSGQQALGSVLGTFGQSRQLGIMPGISVSATSGVGRGFASVSSATNGGFAGFSSTSTSGGFGGFAGAAGGGGFGAFSQQQQGNVGFPTPMGGGGNTKPPDLFTMIRK